MVVKFGDRAVFFFTNMYIIFWFVVFFKLIFICYINLLKQTKLQMSSELDYYRFLYALKKKERAYLNYYSSEGMKINI